ncbi:hypothetical protein AsAng_0040470 [Aureispira anguillae]|uniref:Uncharacterized protein n=1 Tax=Aureispira anguillae TaxID=2864201 RepID=A0A915YHW8_9BACT|nr:hypothetical protein AsAng_0040470 [Aureispira anguillae]
MILAACLLNLFECYAKQIRTQSFAEIISQSSLTVIFYAP